MSFRPYKKRETGSTKALFGAMAEEAGGIERAGFLIGVGRSQAYAFADPAETDRNISLDQARRLALALSSRAYAEDASALAGGFFCPAEPGGEVAALSALGALKFGQFTARLLAALGDGQVDARERAELLDLLNQLLAALSACRGRLMRE